MIQVVTQPLSLVRRPLEGVELPESASADSLVVGTYYDGKLIARALVPEEWDPEAEAAFLEAPRQVLSVAEELEGGALRATLSAMIPGSALPREPWQPERPDDEYGLLPLGVVVRLAHDRKHPESVVDDLLDLHETLFAGGAMPVVDKLLNGL